MIEVKFTASSKNNAFSKALKLWYKEYSEKYTISEFLSKCTWGKEGSKHIVTFFGLPL